MFIPSNAAFVYSCKHILWISITRFYLCLPYSLVYHSVCLQCGRLGFNPQVGKIPWRRKWRSTPVLLLGKSHGQRSLVGYSPWGRRESDTTERLHFHFSLSLFTFISWVLFLSKSREESSERTTVVDHVFNMVHIVRQYIFCTLSVRILKHFGLAKSFESFLFPKTETNI